MSYRNSSGSLGEREMLLQHEFKTSVSTDFSSSQTSDFYNSTEIWMMLFFFSISKHIRNMFISRRELSLTTDY